jgi:hypothetical protein
MTLTEFWFGPTLSVASNSDTSSPAWKQTDLRQYGVCGPIENVTLDWDSRVALVQTSDGVYRVPLEVE